MDLIIILVAMLLSHRIVVTTINKSQELLITRLVKSLEEFEEVSEKVLQEQETESNRYYYAKGVLDGIKSVRELLDKN